jgi:uncharacterized membrane protein
MGKLIYAILVGIVGAALVHVAIVFMVPHLSKRDAWAYVISTGDAYKFNSGPDKSEFSKMFRLADPMFRVALCHFDLDEGPVRLTASDDPAFWSVSVFSRSGFNLFSNNDRTSPSRVLDLVVANPADANTLKKNMPADLQRSILVEADAGQSFAILRAFEPDGSWRDVVSSFLANARCNPIGP